jgi:tetratricopeptide (TPR) repeat protein
VFALAWVGIADSVNLLRRYAGLPIEALSESEVAIERALELDPHLGEAYAARGYLKDQQQEITEAGASFERALELSPNYAPAYQWYANLLLTRGSPAEALTIRQRGLELDPLSRIMILETGLNLEILGRLDEALAHYKRVLEIDPDYALALRSIAIHYLFTGTKAEAVPWLRRAIASEPTNSELIAMTVATYLDLGDSERARFWLERSHRYETETWFTLFAELIMNVYEQDYENLQAIAKKILAVNPQCFPCVDMIALNAARQGDFETARQLYIDYFPELADAENPVVNLMKVASAIQFAFVLSKMDEESHAESLRSTALAVMSESQRLGFFGFGISDVLVYAQQGERDKALRTLRAAFDEGWRSFWWADLRNPVLDFVRDEPEFIAIVAEIEADMAAQLEEIREMERNGELAPLPAALQ